MTPTRFRELIELLSSAKVEFIVVGGVAAGALGSPRVTLDLDIVYRRNPENLTKIVAALAPHQPYPRGAPPGLPFKWDARTLQFGLNFTLETSLGLVDLLGEVTGGGSYEKLLPHTIRLDVFGFSCLSLDLETLIHVKRAAGRTKDFEAIAELEMIREEQEKQQQ